MNNKRIEKVKDLRISLKTKQDGISQDPGVYRWWVKKEAAKKLLSTMPKIDWSKVQSAKINGKEYLALYFGIAKHLRQRLNWHINQEHRPSAVRSGFLSTLRQTLSALHGVPMSEAENTVNDFMDENCYLEFGHTTSRQDAEEKERYELTHNYYPLNVQGNKVVEKEVIKTLSNLRKEYKK